MKTLDLVALIWFAASSLITFAAFGLDKWRAARDANRISELTLVLLGAIGGWLGGWLGMTCFRHKTIKFSFRLKYMLGLAPFAMLIWCWWHYR